jgi:hypothetical protein
MNSLLLQPLLFDMMFPVPTSQILSQLLVHSDFIN